MPRHSAQVLSASAVKRYVQQQWWLSGAMLLALVWAGMAHAADTNIFAEHYNAQNTSELKSREANPDTKIYVSNHQNEDNISMLEKGYDLMGLSSFSATQAPAEMALAHGKAIKADTILLYRKYESAKTASSKLQLIKEAAKKGSEIDPNDLEEEPTQYRYTATYWAKLPMPLLGVHLIKLQKKSADEAETLQAEAGLKLIAVIQDSPAAKAGIVRGDTLVKIGETPLDKPEDLFAAVARYAGQTVSIELVRGGQITQVNVNLAKK